MVCAMFDSGSLSLYDSQGDGCALVFHSGPEHRVKRRFCSMNQAASQLVWWQHGPFSIASRAEKKPSIGCSGIRTMMPFFFPSL